MIFVLRLFKIMVLSLILSFMTTSMALANSKKVVVSFSILEDVVKNIVPADYKVETIVKPGLDSHGFEPMAHDYLAFKKSDIIILVGPSFDAWADKLAKKVKTKAKIFYVTKDLPLIALHEDDGHHHEGFDPHFWHSPSLMIRAIQNLSVFLQTENPPIADEVKKKTSTYISEIQKLSESYKKQFLLLPESRKIMVVAHNSFQYFGEEFGVKVEAPLDASQEGESSLKKVSSLIQKIKNQRIESLFLEKSSPESLMQSLAKQTGYTIKGTLYSDCLSANDDAPTYLKLLDYNLSLILKSMKGSKP